MRHRPFPHTISAKECRDRDCLSRGCTLMPDLSKSRLRMSIDGQTIGAAILFHVSVCVCRARHLRALNRHRSIDVNKLCDDIIATSRGILCVGMTYGLFLPTYFCLSLPPSYEEFLEKFNGFLNVKLT